MGADRIRVMQVLEATVGGTRHYLLDLAFNLPRDRFAQHLLVSTQRDPSFSSDIDRLREAGITVTVVPMLRNIHPLSDLRCYRQIMGEIRTWKPHVVHSHSSKAGFLTRLAARNCDCARLYSPHCFAFRMSGGQVRRAFYRDLERLAGRHTDLLVMPCESERKIAIAQGIVPSEKVVVIPTGLRIEDYQSPMPRDEARARLGLSSDATVIGTVGALNEQKGHVYLLEAFARLHRDDAILLLVGEGRRRKILLELATSLGIAARVRFIGQRDDVPELLRTLDIFVLPSLWEGLPYALLEATAAGVPLVTSDIPGCADIADGTSNGWLAPARTVKPLRNALAEALSDRQEAARRAANALKLVRAKHTLEHMIDSYSELYARLGAEHRG